VDFQLAPAEATGADVLLVDGTYFACSAGGSVPAFTQLLANMVTHLRARSTVVAFDSGLRKQAVAGSVEARRERAAPRPTRGSSERLALALHTQLGLPSVRAPDGLQGDCLLVGMAAALAAGGPPTRRVLLVSGDEDLAVALRRPNGEKDSTQVDWLRCAGFPTSSWPKALTLVDWPAFLHRRGYAPERHALYGALAGRPRDGAAGLRGLGARGAAKAVKAFGGDPSESDARVLERLFDAAHAGGLSGWTPEVRGALCREGAREEAARNLALITPGAGWEGGAWTGVAGWTELYTQLRARDE